MPVQQTTSRTAQSFPMELQQDSTGPPAAVLPALQLQTRRSLEQEFSDTESLCSASQNEASTLDDLKAIETAATSQDTALSLCRNALTQLPAQLKHYATVATRAASSLSCSMILQPKAEIYALLALPVLMWWSAVLSGALVHEGLPKGQKVKHCMLWFDRGVLRPAGAALPFLVFFQRVASHAIDHGAKHGAASLPAGIKAVVVQAATRSRRKQRLKLGSSIDLCLMLYVVVAVVRAMVYLLHCKVLSSRVLEYHLLSDHMFLAGSVLSCLHLELLCTLSDMQHILAPPKPSHTRKAKAQQTGQQGLLLLVMLAMVFFSALSLYVCLAADMFYTAKYYHSPLESCCSAAVVLLMFQLPVVAGVGQTIRARAEQ